ncbi:MAG TPA: hypothetical protein VGL61_06455 [Kofleriaceae bacterium]
MPASGLVDSRWLGDNTPRSRSFYDHARLVGEGPPYHRIGGRIVYRWTEVQSWLESELERGKAA